VRKSAVRKSQEKVILLADDDRELNDGLRSLLEKRGHRVIQAFDGVQAKELVRQEEPDLLILDVMMPRLGGYPVLEHLQSGQ
jgi:DNA-binding response OmpR family regulator